MLCVADHHEFLTDVSSTAHSDQKLPDVLLYVVLSLGDNHSGLWEGKGHTRVWSSTLT